MHHSANLFKIISSHSHNEQKQPQSFLWYRCSVTMVKILLKISLKENSWTKLDWYLWLFLATNNKYVVKNGLLQNNYWCLLPLFCLVLLTKLHFVFKLTWQPYIFCLKCFLRKGPLTIKLRKNLIRFLATPI